MNMNARVYVVFAYACSCVRGRELYICMFHGVNRLDSYINVYLYICVLCITCSMWMKEGAEVNFSGCEDGAKYMY